MVLDTNVLVSGIAYAASNPGKILAAWRRGSVAIVLSPHIIEELSLALRHMNHRLNWRPQQFDEEVELLALQVEIVEPTIVPKTAVRDASDLPILGTLLAFRTDYLITGDKDLLAVADQYPIVTPAEFWRKHGG